MATLRYKGKVLEPYQGDPLLVKYSKIKHPSESLQLAKALYEKAIRETQATTDNHEMSIEDIAKMFDRADEAEKDLKVAFEANEAFEGLGEERDEDRRRDRVSTAWNLLYKAKSTELRDSLVEDFYRACKKILDVVNTERRHAQK